LVADDASSVYTQVLPVGSNFDCLSWGAVVFSTPVKDTDGDGLLNVWETDQGYYDAKDGSWVPLPGATNGVKDLFVEVDYLVKTGTGAHSHLPKQAALDKVGDAYANNGHNIKVHFDVGNNYQNGDPYIITYTAPDSSTLPDGRGGNVIDEDSIACHDDLLASPPKLCAFPDTPGVVAFKGGFTFLKTQPLNANYDEATCEANTPPKVPVGSTNCVRRFQHGRKDSYHYVLSGHLLGLSKTSFSTFKGNLVSIVNSGTSATVTTSTAHGLSSGNRVSISGAIGDFDLNGTYFIKASPAPTTTTFTITTAGVTDGSYNQTNEPGLTLSFGPPRTTSGWSDFAGADSMVTLGGWPADGADDQIGNTQVQAGTWAHELGHTGGLAHGGYYYLTAGSYVPTFGVNCKPNFLSVMSYLFQTRGLPGGFVDYSGQVLGYQGTPPSYLNDGNLDETAGLGVDVTSGDLPSYGTRWFAPPSALDQLTGTSAATKHCDGTPLLDSD
jgi:hypothetical protein